MALSKTRIHQMTAAQWKAAFPDDYSCAVYLMTNRWPGGVISCPRCGNMQVKAHGTMAFNWLCYACSPSGTNYRFSVIAGTFFENTKVDLRDWFRAIHLMLTSKKDINVSQIQRMMGFGNYKTAWYMCHRVRSALADQDFRKLMGIVELEGFHVGGIAAS